MFPNLISAISVSRSQLVVIYMSPIPTLLSTLLAILFCLDDLRRQYSDNAREVAVSCVHSMLLV